MKFIITNGIRPLSYFFVNGNGTVKDIIGFSWSNYFFYRNYQDAENYLNSMKKQLKARDSIEVKLWLKVSKVLDKLQIKQIKEIN